MRAALSPNPKRVPLRVIRYLIAMPGLPAFCVWSSTQSRRHRTTRYRYAAPSCDRQVLSRDSGPCQRSELGLLPLSRSRMYPTSATLKCRTRVNPSSGVLYGGGVMGYGPAEPTAAPKLSGIMPVQNVDHQPD